MKTSEIDKKLMEISHRITNEISNLTKAKVSSAILRKRSVFESPNPNKNIFIFPTPSLTSKTVTTQDKINEKDSSNTAKWMFQMKIPEKNITSPLIKSRKINNLTEVSKTISDGNNNLTPVIQARTRDLNLGIGMAPMSQYVMNKIERKDIPSKPPIDKPKLTKEHMAIQYSDDIKKSKTSKSKKVTYEKNKNKKRKSSHGITSFFPTKLNSDKLEEKLDKFEEDRNKFEQVKEPMKNTEIKREIACMTPGINKRKLTREANTVIDSQNKQVTSINKIPPFKNDKNKVENKEKTPSTIDSLKKPNLKTPENDIMTKFVFPKEEAAEKIQGSLNYLKQFGARTDKNSESDVEGKKNLFEIPPFKPKLTKAPFVPELEKKKSNQNLLEKSK